MPSMTSKQRIHSAIRGEPVDRIPCAPMLIRFAAAFNRRSLREYFLNGELFAECQIKVVDEFKLDAVLLASEPCRVVATLGGKVSFPENGVPHVDEPLLNDKSELCGLSLPDVLDRTNRMGDLLKAVEILVKHYRGAKSVFGWADAPFAEACNMMTVPGMMLVLVDSPGFAHRLLEFTTELVIAFVRAQIELGVDVIGLGDAAASLVSPEMYREFALPYEQRVIQAVHRERIPVKLHMCGNNNQKLPWIVSTGLDILNVDQTTDIYQARRLAPRLCLKGNLDPVNIMNAGSPAVVQNAAIRLINDIGPQGYILSAGCELPPEVPYENLRALVGSGECFT